MPSKVWGEVTNPFLNFNGATVEAWEWIRNFITHFMMQFITYPCLDKILKLILNITGLAKKETNLFMAR